VKTNIEYQAMQKEIGFAQSEVRALEDRILERMLEADELSAEVKRAEATLATEQKDVDGERQALTNAMAGLRASMNDLVSRREQIVGQLDSRVLAIFDLVSKRRHGVAVAEARDGICTICHVRLRPQVFNNVRRNNDIVQCDSCQRILYFVPLAPVASDDGSASTS
jgi:predicted  nucleic acid-binding Zn-ribbon protein